jgi:lactate dehydrogenase-like 2-hydroxyacid dehydrogenase
MSSKPCVLSLSAMYGPKQQVAESLYEVHHYGAATDKSALLQSIAAKCQVLLTTGGRGAEKAILEQLPNLRLVACFGVGVDAIDLEFCKSKGIAVSNTPDVLTEDVADMAVGLLLAAVRQLPQGDRFVREGHWLKGGMPLTQTMQRRRVGIVGMGRIGQAIAKRLVPFNCEIAYMGPRKKVDLPYTHFLTTEALGEWADVIVAACPGGKATEKVVSRAALKALGKEGIFVNIARGSVVDQVALVEFLLDGQLGGAGLDVFNDEPRVPEKLFSVPHIVLQPHQGSATADTRAAMGQLTLDNVAAFFAGQALKTPVTT